MRKKNAEQTKTMSGNARLKNAAKEMHCKDAECKTKK